MAYGYDVTNLPSYTRQDAASLIFEKVYNEMDTAKYAQFQTNVKSASTINIVATELVHQAQGCSFNASGTTTFSQRTITVGKIKVDGQWCERDLEPKYLQEAMKNGGNYDSLTFNTQIVNDVMQKIKYRNEIALWQGDTNHTDQYRKHFDGLIKIIGAASGVASYSGTAWSVANSRTVVQGILDAIPNDVYAAGTVKIFMGHDMVRDYRRKLSIDNLYHVNVQGSDSLTILAENTNIEIVGVNGLTGTDKAYAIEPDNIYIGVDAMNEEDKVEMWFSQDDRVIKMTAEWKLGVQVAFPSRIVKYLGV